MRDWFGSRAALGAQARDVLALVVGDGLELAVLGTVAGVAAALATTRFLEKLLYGVSPEDPTTFAGVVVTWSRRSPRGCPPAVRRAWIR